MSARPDAAGERSPTADAKNVFHASPSALAYAGRAKGNLMVLKPDRIWLDVCCAELNLMVGQPNTVSGDIASDHASEALGVTKLTRSHLGGDNQPLSR